MPVASIAWVARLERLERLEPILQIVRIARPARLVQLVQLVQLARFFRFVPILLSAFAGIFAPPPASAQTPLPPVELSAGIHLIHAELADNNASRMLGLMYRRDLAPNHGMLFVFDESGAHCMWMRNTYIPLSVAFIDQNGVVVNIEEMAPQTDDSHCALRPTRYALEMGARWFKEHGIAPGARISGIVKTAEKP